MTAKNLRDHGPAGKSGPQTVTAESLSPHRPHVFTGPETWEHFAHEVTTFGAEMAGKVVMACAKSTEVTGVTRGGLCGDQAQSRRAGGCRAAGTGRVFAGDSGQQS